MLRSNSDKKPLKKKLSATLSGEKKAKKISLEDLYKVYPPPMSPTPVEEKSRTAFQKQ